jgi:hypothetical protein
MVEQWRVEHPSYLNEVVTLFVQGIGLLNYMRKLNAKALGEIDLRSTAKDYVAFLCPYKALDADVLQVKI